MKQIKDIESDELLAETFETDKNDLMPNKEAFKFINSEKLVHANGELCEHNFADDLKPYGYIYNKTDLQEVCTDF